MFRIWGGAHASLAASRISYSRLAFAKPAAAPISKLSCTRVARQQTVKIRNYSQGRYLRQDQYHQYQEEEHGRQNSDRDPNNGRVRLLRHILWAFAFSVGTYYVCAGNAVEYQAALNSEPSSIISTREIRRGISKIDQRTRELMNDKRVQALVGAYHKVTGFSHARNIHTIAHMPQFVSFEQKRTAISLVDQWHNLLQNLSPSERCVYRIVGINAAVFCMWRFRRMLPLMTRCFLHDPRSGRAYTMLTSTFSHKDLIHFAFNNYALISFGTIVANEMGAEQFTAFYLTAGVISSLASQIFAPLLPALMIPSLGASGAIYGVVGAAMLMFPDIQLSFIFLSAFPTSISTLFPALMAVDFIGIICGWKAINHVSHFAGGLFGIAYVKWGRDIWSSFLKAITEVRAKHKRPNS